MKTKYNVNNTYIQNSATFYTSIFSQEYFVLLYILICLSTIMLIHSFWVKGFKFDMVRKLSDLANFSALIYSIFIIIAYEYPNPSNGAILYDLFSEGILTCIVQLCDNYMFYSRFVAVKKVSKWKKILIHSFIWIVLVCTWLPAQTFIPLFYNTNTDDFYNYYTLTLSIQAYATLAYNWYFTFEFGVILYDIFKGKSQYSSRTFIISIKSIIHCFTSTLAGFISNYILNIGFVIYIIIIVIGLHFLFNYKLENVLFNEKYTLRSSSKKSSSYLSKRFSIASNRSSLPNVLVPRAINVSKSSNNNSIREFRSPKVHISNDNLSESNFSRKSSKI